MAAETKLHSLVVCSLLTTKRSGSQPIRICLPHSLEKCKKEKQIKETKETMHSDNGDTTCDVKIPELKGKRQTDFWETLEKMLKEDYNLFSKYKKVSLPL
jgi:hypothetical protein